MRPRQLTLEELGTPLVDVEFAVIDLETTGGSPSDDRITEVGVVKVRGGEVTGTFQTLVRPDVPIPPMISALTGITDGMVATAEPIETVLPCLVEFLGGAVMVAHNAAFDLRFVQANLERHGYPRLTNRVVCTARLARTLLPRDEVPNVRLATLADQLHARTRPCHRAFADARATVDVLHALLERAAGFGVLALEDLLTFPTVRVQQRHSYAKVRLTDGLPRSPGVYLFRSRHGEVLYVGKAKDLRARVRSYFSGDGRAKVTDLLAELASIDHVPCTSELEAGVREVRLIQRHRPRYNRRGRDPERHYCYLKLTRERWPRLSIVRKPLDDGASYLGPLTSTVQAELVKTAIEDALPLRRCTQAIGARKRAAACALLELGRCPGPCTGEADAGEYAQHAATLARCLEGGDPEPLLAPLRARMRRYAGEQRYEHAALARDRLEALSRALGDARRTATVRAAGELVLARPHPDGREVTVLRQGQLVSVTVVPATAAPPLATGEGPAPVPGPPPRHLADEIRLVTRWLDQVAGEAEILAVSGALASPAIGGAALQVRYDPGRHRHLVPGEARGRPILRPRALPGRRSRARGQTGRPW
ncbi:MAG TPA: DEDD exonuclease domain-containing protein [Actinomycetes bacterium]|nr:DEDD exonuclease domain-containing protein [Actinomycetes bacterium]